MKTISKRLADLIPSAGIVMSLIVFASTPAFAVPIDQWAATVIDYSSTWNTWARERGNTTTQRYTPEQALGSPNVFAYGENGLSWSPYSVNGTLEYISLGFDIPVYSDGVTIRETLGNGFVYEVEALSTSGQWFDVWSGIDTSTRGTVVDFLVSFPETTYLVAGVRIRVNTNAALNAYEEIDAIQLHGRIPECGTAVMLTLGLLSLAICRLRRENRSSEA